MKGLKPRPIGPITLSEAPTGWCDSASRPGPTILYRISIQPASGSARMIDSGRRIGISRSQLRWAKLPGVAARAHFDAARRSTNWAPGKA